MMRYLLIFSTVLALLGCPLRCALAHVEFTALDGQSSGAIPTSGCACCQQRSQSVACSPATRTETPSNAPASPTPEDCNCLCLCKGAIVEKPMELPQLAPLAGLLPAWAFDELSLALSSCPEAYDGKRWLTPSPPPSGRVLCFLVQSLLI